MSASDYNKQDAVNFGRAVGDLIHAVRKDGAGMDDFQKLIGVVTAAASVVNETKDVPEAATEHILGAASDCMGDHALQGALDAEAAGG